MRILETTALGCLLFGLAGTSTVAEAQVTTLEPTGETVFAVDWAKPQFGSDGFDFLTSSLRTRLITPVGQRAGLYVDWRLVYAKAGDISSLTLSNPEVGIVFNRADGSRAGAITVTAPLLQEWGDDDIATAVGALSDFQHLEHFGDDLYSVNVDVQGARAAGETSKVGLRGGATMWIPTQDGADPEVVGRYAAFFSAGSDAVVFGGELTGMAIISEGDLSLSERTMHELSISAGLVREGARPEVFLTVPLDDALDALDFVAGVRLTF